jgi:hypothetical protein
MAIIQNYINRPPTKVKRGTTIDIYMNPAGDDNFTGLTPFDPIATIGRLNEVLNQFFLDSYDATVSGNQPDIDITMAAGTYLGGIISLPSIGQGAIFFNVTNQAVIMDSTLAFINCSPQCRIFVQDFTFTPEGFDRVYTYTSKGKTYTSTAGNIYSNGGSTSFISTYLLFRTFDFGYEHASMLVVDSVVRTIDCIFEDSDDVDDIAAVVVDGGSSILDIINPTIRTTSPLVFMNNGARLTMSSPTFDYAAPTPLRYLIQLGINCNCQLRGTPTVGNLELVYFVRTFGGQSLTFNDSWAAILGSVPTFADAGPIDNNYSHGSIIVNGPNQSSQIIERTFLVNSNQTVRPDEFLGCRYMFYGSGVTGTVQPIGNFSNSTKMRGQSCKFAAYDSAQLVVDFSASSGGAPVFVNGARNLTPLANLTGAAGTSIEVYWFNVQNIHISILEGALV